VISVWLAIASGLTTDDRPAPTTAESRRTAQRALEPFNALVGNWRGVGQPRRMSAQGAWNEQAQWQWKLDKESASVVVLVKDGKLLSEGRLTYDAAPKRFRFDVRLPDGTAATYSGTLDTQQRLELIRDEPNGIQHRITLRMLHDDRITMLFETRRGESGFFARQAEIGYTRIGGKFAAAGDGYPKCIVTGGRGTIAVRYQGKTYYVCCSGCQQAFEDDPEGTIAAAAEQAKQAKAKSEE
jgi:YHS domain-containing protein